MKKYDSQASGGQIAILSTTRHGTLAGRISAWFDQRSPHGPAPARPRPTPTPTSPVSPNFTPTSKNKPAAAADLGQLTRRLHPTPQKPESRA